MKARLLVFTLLILIFQNCKKSEELRPKAEFTVNMLNISLNDTVKFINSSLNATSYIWHFTDGSPEYSTEKDPEVIYKKMGRFSVSLEVSNPEGNDIINKDSLIIVDYTYVGAVNEGILYKKLMGDTIKNDFFTIDLNKDGVNDVKLDCSAGTVCGGSSSSRIASIKPLNNNVLILSDSISPKILTFGDVLENQVGWNSNISTLFYSAYIWCSNPPLDINSGNWNNIDHQYIGIKLNNKFGWIQVGTGGSGGWKIHDRNGFVLRVYDYGIKK